MYKILDTIEKFNTDKAFDIEELFLGDVIKVLKIKSSLCLSINQWISKYGVYTKQKIIEL